MLFIYLFVTWHGFIIRDILHYDFWFTGLNCICYKCGLLKQLNDMWKHSLKSGVVHCSIPVVLNPKLPDLKGVTCTWMLEKMAKWCGISEISWSFIITCLAITNWSSLEVAYIIDESMCKQTFSTLARINGILKCLTHLKHMYILTLRVCRQFK
jgi:hypothetical protein